MTSSLGGDLELDETFGSTSGRWESLGSTLAGLQEGGNLGLRLGKEKGSMGGIFSTLKSGS